MKKTKFIRSKDKKAIKLYTKNGHYITELTEYVKNWKVDIFGTSLELLDITLNCNNLPKNIEELLLKNENGLELKLYINFYGALELNFYITPKYYWNNKKMVNVIERRIAPCQLIFKDKDIIKILINKRTKKAIIDDIVYRMLLINFLGMACENTLLIEKVGDDEI